MPVACTAFDLRPFLSPQVPDGVRARAIVRQAHARPVEGDHPDALRFGRLVAKAPFDPRPGLAVKVEERPAAEIAPIRITQSAAVPKSDHSGRPVLHGGKCSPPGARA
jgi:hypothetical protein